MEGGLSPPSSSRRKAEIAVRPRRDAALFDDRDDPARRRAVSSLIEQTNPVTGRPFMVKVVFSFRYWA